MNFEEPPEPQPIVQMPEPQAPQEPQPLAEATPATPEQKVILALAQRLDRIETYLKDVSAKTPTENVGSNAAQAPQPMHPLVEMGLRIAEKIAERLGGGATSPISEEVAKRMMDAFWSAEVRRFQRQLGFTEHMVFTPK